MVFKTSAQRKAFFAKLRHGTVIVGKRVGERAYEEGQKAWRIPEERGKVISRIMPELREIDQQKLQITKTKNRIRLLADEIKKVKAEGRAEMAGQITKLNAEIIDLRGNINASERNIGELKQEIVVKKRAGISSPLGRML